MISYIKERRGSLLECPAINIAPIAGDCQRTRYSRAVQFIKLLLKSKMERSVAVSLLILCLLSCGICYSPCYDHQEDTYDTQFKPTDCGSQCTVTPFFSPDHSVDAYVSLMKDAKENIDLLEPGFKSWSNCTNYYSDCGGKCVGCTLEEQYKEPFPIFPALLNAIHINKVNVRFLTNDFYIPTCSNSTTPLDWLFVNGVQIKLYKTTTFMHAKFMIIDKGRRVLISSVNFSKTSFTRNRESGVILTNCNCPLIDMYQNVFNSDWDTGYDYQLTRTYTQNDKEFMTNPKAMDTGNTGPFPIPGAFVTSLTDHNEVTVLKGYTAPDNARNTFMNDLESVKKSLVVHIYQVTDSAICDKLLELFNNGVNVTMLVGSYIVSYTDYKMAQECYSKLYEGGMKGKIQKTYTKFSFSHQKYWIIDDTTVHLSTGNWSPSDFPTGTDFPPYKKSRHSVNRDMLVVMQSPDIVNTFMEVFTNDWYIGSPWLPKNGVHYMSKLVKKF